MRLSILECNFIVEDSVKSICVTGGVSSEDEDDLRLVATQQLQKFKFFKMLEEFLLFGGSRML